MSNVNTTTTLPAGTPVIEIGVDVARSLASGDLWSLAGSDILTAMEADAATAVQQIDAGAKEAFIVIRIVAA